MNSEYWTRPVWAVLLLPALTGCSHLGFGVEEVTQPDPSSIAESVKKLYQAAGDTEPKPIEPAVFAQAGYRAVFTSCNTYFDVIVKASHQLKMTKADVTALGSAAAVIATLAEATPKEIGIIAAVFGLGAVAIDNYEQYAFATPYPTQTRDLVLKALAAYRESSNPKNATSLSDAADQIAGYANLCTYSGIAALSADAIAKATPVDLSKPALLFSDAERAQYLQPVNNVLGLTPGTTPTDNDYVTLAAISDPNANTALLDSLGKAFSTNISASIVKEKLYDTAVTPHERKTTELNAIWSLLSPLLTTNTEFAKKVEAKKGTVTGQGALPAPEPESRVGQPVIGIVSH